MNYCCAHDENRQLLRPPGTTSTSRMHLICWDPLESARCFQIGQIYCKYCRKEVSGGVPRVAVERKSDSEKNQTGPCDCVWFPSVLCNGTRCSLNESSSAGRRRISQREAGFFFSSLSSFVRKRSGGGLFRPSGTAASQITPQPASSSLFIYNSTHEKHTGKKRKKRKHR